MLHAKPRCQIVTFFRGQSPFILGYFRGQSLTNSAFCNDEFTETGNSKLDLQVAWGMGIHGDRAYHLFFQVAQNEPVVAHCAPL